MGWQQVVMILLLAFDLAAALIMHGKPKEGSYNFWVSLLTDGLIVLLLMTGGFFK